MCIETRIRISPLDSDPILRLAETWKARVSFDATYGEVYSDELLLRPDETNRKPQTSFVVRTGGCGCEFGVLQSRRTTESQGGSAPAPDLARGVADLCFEVGSLTTRPWRFELGWIGERLSNGEEAVSLEAFVVLVEKCELSSRTYLVRPKHKPRKGKR